MPCSRCRLPFGMAVHQPRTRPHSPVDDHVWDEQGSSSMPQQRIHYSRCHRTQLIGSFQRSWACDTNALGAVGARWVSGTRAGKDDIPLWFRRPPILFESSIDRIGDSVGGDDAVTAKNYLRRVFKSLQAEKGRASDMLPAYLPRYTIFGRNGLRASPRSPERSDDTFEW